MADEEIDKFIRKQRSQQTVYKDHTETNRLKKFCESVGKNRELENIPPVELNKILCSFFMTAKRKDGKEYEPGSLTSFQNTLQHILVVRGSKINIKTDTEFEKSGKVPACKRKELTSNGYGNHPNVARVLKQEEIYKLYQKGFFGTASPLALQRALWWITGSCFCSSFGVPHKHFHSFRILHKLYIAPLHFLGFISCPATKMQRSDPPKCSL